MCLWSSTIQALCLLVWYYIGYVSWSSTIMSVCLCLVLYRLCVFWSGTNIGYVSLVKYHKGYVSLVQYYTGSVSFGLVLYRLRVLVKYHNVCVSLVQYYTGSVSFGLVLIQAMCLWSSTIKAVCLWSSTIQALVWYYNIGCVFVQVRLVLYRLWSGTIIQAVSSFKYHKGYVSLVWYYVSYVSFDQVLLSWGTVHV